jgi:hypothetical protein
VVCRLGDCSPKFRAADGIFGVEIDLRLGFRKDEKRGRGDWRGGLYRGWRAGEVRVRAGWRGSTTRGDAMLCQGSCPS